MAGKRFRKGLAAGVFALALALPASASAGGLVDTYVDLDTGADTNPCTLALPCETIQQGIDEADPGGTVHVDPDTYALGLQIGDGKSLLAEEFVGGPEGAATVTGAGFPALDVVASGAGTVSGFSFSATNNPVINVAGPLNLEGNTVLTGTAGADATGVQITTAMGDDVTIEDNDFFGDNTTLQRAIGAEGPDLRVINNDFGSASNGFRQGIFVGMSASALVAGNRFRALHQAGIFDGLAIFVRDVPATITANSVRDSGAGTVIPIAINEGADPANTSADLHRNELYGQGLGEGIQVIDTEGAVTLDGDLVTGFSTGLSTDDVGADSPTDADVSVTGATLWENGTADIDLDDSDLMLDSTIMSIGVTETGSVSCTITFSRAAADVASASGCTDVQTVEGPQFVEPAPIIGDPDLHLTAGSAMLDAGNPATPSEQLDIDGLPRLADSDQQCPEELRRDIGADEFGALLDCDPPQTRIKGKKRSKKPRVRFKLSSDEPGSTFRCKLDRKPYRNCKARYRTKRLDPGRHKLKVKATDAAGNQDPSPAVKRFRVIEPN